MSVIWIVPDESDRRLERYLARRSRITSRSPAHDDQHIDGALALAAACYALLPILPDLAHRLYPWRFKPAGDRIHDLAKAGALIAAEIDRLQRVAP